MASTYSIQVHSERVLKLRLPVDIVGRDGKTTALHEVQVGTFPIYCKTNNRRHAAKTFMRTERRFGKGVRMLGKTFKRIGD